MIWRIKSALAPPDPANSNAEAQNLFSYPLPNVFPVTAMRQKSITNAFMDSVTSSYDGLARVFKTEHAMPSGSPATVVTTYDDVHEKVSVTNPYFSTADSTYGSTTTQSDALGRPTTITEQDGSVKTVNYNVVTPATVQGDCNTSIDEAGHQHRSCTDGLGRLVEVDEPNPGAGTSTAQANVTINGHEQATPQAVVPGTGWVTISGNELPAQVCQDTLPGHPPFCHTVYDSGSVTITVNGYPEVAGYSVSQNTTAAAMAATLAGDFHNDPASPVDAVIDPSNAAKINFTSRSQTVGGNYTLSVSESTDDPTDFGAGSYSYTKSGATLTGGRDATTNPDTGDVTITVNGVAYTTSFGGSDTDGSGIASRLANLISAGPYADATAVGTTIKLTSKTAGPAGNYSLAASYTWNSASFAQPSFTTAADPELAGGYNPGDVNNQTYATLYQYDALGNLLCVEQHGGVTGTGCSASPASDASSPWRVRRFTYDSLSRLLTAHNPESGTITYSYDADGNLLQKTSPAPNQISSATQTISYCYDELHRVTGKAWSAQTCPLSSRVVTYTYDSGANAKGKLTGVTDQAGSAGYSYDVLGRLASETRVIAGVSKSISYEYNLDGSLKTLHYPSGAAITYAPDSAGRILSAIDSANNINYATAATYQADGQMGGFVSGNGGAFSGITSAFSYNKRLQPINMSANAPGQTVFSIGYDFHVGNGTSGSDNGNVWNIYNFRDRTRDQSFNYDALNRLTSAQNAGTDCNALVLQGKNKFWGNNYTYDPWGNLTNKTKIPTACAGELLSAPALLNNQLSGYGYDAAGNMTSDPTDNVTASYDAENQIASASTAQETFVYTYDADGNRVEKSGGGSSTLYWYMTPGIVAESDLAGNLKSEYVFFNGERVARKDFDPATHAATGVFYYFSDHLKTASVITDATGNIKSESDYYPWGGELQFVNNDSNHYKFTGKERDSESGLDYFGARYYSNGLGRFITPDWAAKAMAVPYAEFADPQSLNLYSYARNVPTTKYDADGHCLEDACVIEGLVAGGMAVSSYLASPSGQQALRAGVHLADAATSWAAQKGLQGIHALKNALSSKAAPASNPAPGTETKTSNPARPGTLGKPDHQETVKDEAARIGGKTEVKIPTPGGSKESRRADAAETNEDGTYKAGGQIIQVIRPTPAGNVPKREQQAAQDIENATGVKPQLVPIRPVPKEK